MDERTSLTLSFNINTTVEIPFKKRVKSLDVFRGLSIFFMILVDNQGNGDAAFSQLQHAEWNGFTFADVVFPSFLFIVGVSIALVFFKKILGFFPCCKRTVVNWAAFRKVLKRTALMFLVGLSINIINRLFDFHTLRIMGILQRIALCYFFVSASALLLTHFEQWLAMIAFLSIFLFVTYVMPVPGCGRGVLTPECCAEGFIDRTVFTTNHITKGNPYYDPEGLLSTLTSTFLTFSGFQFGVILKLFSNHKTRIQIWMCGGVFLILIGGLLSIVAPLNKNLFSVSFAFLTSGIAAVSLTICYIIVDVFSFKKFFCPFKWLGLNPLVIFVSQILLEILLLKIKVANQTLWAYIYERGFASWSPPPVASLLVALTHVALWLTIAWCLHRKRIYVKL